MKTNKKNSVSGIGNHNHWVLDIGYLDLDVLVVDIEYWY